MSPAPFLPRRQQADAESARARRTLVIAILASSVAFLDGTIVNVALPAIMRDLGGGLSTQQWAVDSYLLTLGAFILVAGSVSDAFGRRRVLTLGVVGFGVASVAVAAAPTATVLIVARLAQGLAGALLVPSSLALISSAFDGAARSRAIGIWTASTSGAMIAGPVVGGLFVDLASWRWAFVVNVIPAAVTVWLVRGLGREVERDPGAPAPHVDFLSAALAALGLGGAVFALIEQPHLGWSHPAVWASAVGGIGVLAAFVVRQRLVERPLLPLEIFRVRNVAWGNVATLFVYAALGLNSMVLSVFLQQTAGFSATLAGLASLPVTLVMVALSARVGAWAGSRGPRLFMTLGPLAMAAGTLTMLRVTEDANYWTQLLPGIVLIGLGLTATVTPLTAAVLAGVSSARAGIASAVNNAIARIAGLVAVASVGAIAGGALDLDGFHRSVVAMAAMLLAGAVASWVGIRNMPDAAPKDVR